MNRYRKRKQFSRLFAGCMSIIGIILLLAACSSSNSDSSTQSENIALSNEAKAGESLQEAGEATGSSDTIPLTGMHQKIIYNADLTMQVEDLDKAVEALKEAIQQSEGYLLEFSDTQTERELRSNYVIKVPAKQFMPFINQLSMIKNRKFDQYVSGKDVSEEYVDLEARLKARELVEERLLAMMGEASTASDLLEFSQRLGEVQEQMEQIKGRIRYLDNNISFSTINLRIFQAKQSAASLAGYSNPLGERITEAWHSSITFVWEAIQTIIVILIGAFPIIVILAVIAVPIWLIRRKRKNAASFYEEEDSEESNDEDVKEN